MRDEHLHAVVARSTCASHNDISSTCSNHLRKLSCVQSAPLWREACFDVKYKNRKKPHARTTFGSCELEKGDKQWMPSWRKAHFQVKMYKAHQSTTCSDHFCKEVATLHAIVARNTFPSQKVQNITCSDHFWTSKCQKVYAFLVRNTFASKTCQTLRAWSRFRILDVVVLKDRWK